MRDRSFPPRAFEATQSPMSLDPPSVNPWNCNGKEQQNLIQPAPSKMRIILAFPVPTVVLVQTSVHLTVFGNPMSRIPNASILEQCNQLPTIFVMTLSYNLIIGGPEDCEQSGRESPRVGNRRPSPPSNPSLPVTKVACRNSRHQHSNDSNYDYSWLSHKHAFSTLV